LDAQSSFETNEDFINTNNRPMARHASQLFVEETKSSADEPKQQLSFAAACKQQAGSVWSRINLQTEINNGQQNAQFTQQSVSRLSVRDGPLNNDFFTCFTELLEKTICEATATQSPKTNE
jgi:hypothetical protein